MVPVNVLKISKLCNVLNEIHSLFHRVQLLSSTFNLKSQSNIILIGSVILIKVYNAM